jgi:hypothetical protein
MKEVEECSFTPLIEPIFKNYDEVMGNRSFVEVKGTREAV